jgi:translation initiation factor 3 subunit H
MAATSMAAALAASLPAPQAASTPAAPTYEAIPASMSKAVDIEAEIPLTCVQIDGLVGDRLQEIYSEMTERFSLQVVTKILKHGREAPSTTAHGLLLGLDLDGTLEISNSFPLPHHASDDDDKSSKSIGETMSLRYHSARILTLVTLKHDTRRQCCGH